MDDFNDVSEDGEETRLQGNPHSPKKKKLSFIVLISLLCVSIVVGVMVGLIVGLTGGPPSDPKERAVYLMSRHPLIGTENGKEDNQAHSFFSCRWPQ